MHSDSKSKKQSKLMKPLQLSKETLRELTDPASQEAVVGGNAEPVEGATSPCTSMRPCMSEYDCSWRIC